MLFFAIHEQRTERLIRKIVQPKSDLLILPDAFKQIGTIWNFLPVKS